MSKNKKKGILSDVAIYFFSNVLVALVPLALMPVLTRYLGPEGYGEVAMFQVLIAALAAFVGLNTVRSANRKYYDVSEQLLELKFFVGACLQILLVSSILIFFIIFIFSSQLSVLFGLNVKWLYYAVIISISSFIIQLRLSLWQAEKNPGAYGLLQVSQSALNMLLSLFFVVVLVLGVDGRLFAQSITVVVFSCIALLLIYKDNLLGLLCWRPDFIKEALNFGVPLIPHVAGVFLLGMLDRLVINKELGLAQAGVYMVAAQLSIMMGLVYDAVNKASIPWLFERLKQNDKNEKLKIVRLTYLYFLISLLSAGMFFIIGPFIIKIFAGEQYKEAGNVIGWLALGHSFGAMYVALTNYIFYSKRTGLLSIVTIISCIINIVLLMWLIKSFGISGAAIAFCVAMFFRFLLTWWVAQKRYEMPWFEYDLFKSSNLNK